MDQTNELKILYHNKTIELEIPSSYEEFLKLLEDKLYLTKKLIQTASIFYVDDDGDTNYISSEDEFKDALRYCYWGWNVKLNLKAVVDRMKNGEKDGDNDDDNLEEEVEEEVKGKDDKKENKNIITPIIDKNKIKNLEKKITKKLVKIFEEKMKQKDLEHQKEIDEIKENYEKDIKILIENNQNKMKELSEYYNDKIKEYLDKYNEMIIQNINDGISRSNINNLAEKFINDNKDNNWNKKDNDIDNDDSNKSNNLFFSNIINHD